jgi:hypothetical protein
MEREMIRQATPTEYRGIVYRSKCEAMFARWLEIDGLEKSGIGQSLARRCGLGVTASSFGFQYEPTTLVEKWNPDFLTWNVSPPWDSRRNAYWSGLIPNIHWKTIEYKPSRPSDRYIKTFYSFIQKWINNAIPLIDKGFDFQRMSFSIYYGNPYRYPESPCGSIDFEPQNYEMVDATDNDWLANNVDDLLAYRFDLKNGGDND